MGNLLMGFNACGFFFFNDYDAGGDDSCLSESKRLTGVNHSDIY